MGIDEDYEKILIEFVELENGHERTVAEFNSYDEVPNNLILNTNQSTNSLIKLEGKKWEIIHIKRKIQAHGNGVHVKVKIEKEK
jgi:hypothetical protein